MVISIPRPRLAGMLGVAFALLIAAPAGGAMQLDKVGDFDSPVFVTAPPGDSQRLLVVERGGSIRLLKDGTEQSEPFLTVPHVKAGGEQGLLSMAFDPSYETSGLFYVYYVRDDQCTGENCDIEIAEFRRSSGNPDRAKPDSYRRVLRIPHRDHPNHNGGQLQFGPDGRLYIGTGDGGGGGDPQDNAQDLDSLLGKLLRIDPRRRKRKAYTIPSGNPFVGQPGRDEIWAYGLRNPWRFSFDRARGDLWIGDVGQNKREEIDYQRKGEGAGDNYGWDVCEGNLQYNTTNPCTAPPPDYHPPIGTYPTVNPVTCSITGGYVSRDRTVGETLGQYVWADFCQGDIHGLKFSNGQATGGTDFDQHVDLVSSFGEDADCRLYVASLSGPVYRIESDDPAADTPGCAGDGSAAPGRRVPGERDSADEEGSKPEDPPEEDGGKPPAGDEGEEGDQGDQGDELPGVDLP